MKRLLDDPQMPATLRGDLQRARDAGHDYPATAKLLQLRAAVSKQAQPGALDALSALPKRALHPGWKLGALAVMAGGAAFFAQPAAQPSQRSPSRAIDSPPLAAAGPSSNTTPPPNAERASSSPSAHAEARRAAPTPEQAADARISDASLSAQTRPVDGALPSSASHESQSVPAAGPSTSRREIAQLLQIRALLARDPVAAHRLALRSEREFPRGLLGEERQALAIVALARTGAQHEAEQNARSYFARYPHSPMRALIEAALRR